MGLEFGDRLGKGGEGSVFSVVDEQSGKELAVKFIKQCSTKPNIEDFSSDILNVYAKLDKIMQESDPGTGHLVPANAIFLLYHSQLPKDKGQEADLPWFAFTLQKSSRERFDHKIIRRDDIPIEVQILQEAFAALPPKCPVAIIMDKYRGSLVDAFEGEDGKPKDERAYEDIKNWPWKVKLQSLNGVLMMREGGEEGHGDFKPENIMFLICHNTIWWACL